MKKIVAGILLTLLHAPLTAAAPAGSTATVAKRESVYIHALSLRASSGGLIDPRPFFRGINAAGKGIENTTSVHLNYSFRARPGSWTDRVFGSPYQGVGLAYTTFHNRQEIGDPVTLYVFQGARLARISPRLSLNYEWGLGASFGWHPYNYYYNYYNDVIGTGTNAYINIGTYFNYAVSRRIDVTAGVSLTHYSNGNTKTPNKGINVLSADIGLRYNFDRKSALTAKPLRTGISNYQRHFVHEFLVFGSWHGVTVDITGTNIRDSYPLKKFAVVGLSYAPLYAIGHKVRLGGSLDFHFDRAAGVEYYEGPGGSVISTNVAAGKQLFMGIAGRIDYTMPYFTLSASIGYDIIHPATNYRPFYQSLSLKVNVSQEIFLNVGYRLSSFKNPNFLILGVGFRINNQNQK